MGSPSIPPTNSKPISLPGHLAENSKLEISAQIAREAQKVVQIRQEHGVLPHNGQDSSKKIQIKSAPKPGPSPESLEVSKLEVKRLGFFAKVMAAFKSFVIKVKDARGFIALSNLVHRINRHKKKTPSLSYGKEVVEKTIALLREMDAHKEQGIFRISGSQAVLNQFSKDIRKQKVDFGKEGSGEKFKKLLKRKKTETVAVADAAGALKSAIRELALLDAVKTDLAAVGGRDDLSNDQKAEKLAGLVAQIDPEQREALKMVLDFLEEVASHSEENLMKPENLAICIAPNMYRENLEDARKNPMEAFRNQQNITTAFQAMIENKDVIFSEVQP